jgi:hypothetical protein
MFEYYPWERISIQRVHAGFVIAQPLDVFKAVSASEDVIGNIQHMIGFPLRHMDLQKLDFLLISLSNFHLHASLCMAPMPPKPIADNDFV